MSDEIANYDDEAEKLIQTPYPGYQEPLALVRGWVRQGGAALRAALRVLEHLRRRHPHALKVAQELVLAYLQNGDRGKAEALVDRLRGDFDDKDEETLCRFGRLQRDLGDARLRGGAITDADRHLAEEEYEKAWQEYNRAFEIDQGQYPMVRHYPGINRAALFLLRAWTAVDRDRRQSLLEQAREAAANLLARQGQWQRTLRDDVVWFPATEAEALLLLGRWDEAIRAYRRALEVAGAVDFYRESVGGEVARLLSPLRELLRLPEDKAQELQNLFSPPSAGPA